MGFIANVKSVFTADTKDLKKGAAEAKQAVKDFDATTTDALNEVTSLFGVSMSEIGKTLSTIRGGFIKLSGGISSTTKEVGFATKALKLFKNALISTGVGALVVALGSLVAYFTKTQRGADALTRVMGQVGQAVKTVTDYAIRLGEKLVNAFKNPKQAIKDFWGLLSNKEERQKLKDDLANLGNDFMDRQKRRDELEKRRLALRDKERVVGNEISEIEAKIADLRLKTDDRLNYSAEQRKKFNAEAIELQKKATAMQLELDKEALAIIQEENALSESMVEDLIAEDEAQKKVNQTMRQGATALKEMVTKQAELNAQINAEIVAREKARVAALNERKKEDLTLEKIDSSAILDKAFEIPEPEIPEQKFKELESYMINIGEIATDFSNTISDAFSSMIEGLVSGELDMRDIFHTVLQFLAENLKAIGKALIAYGMALEAFKNAFKGPGGAIKAIAAGAALVAAGAVLSGLIKRASSGGGSSASASYAAAASVGGGGTLDLTSQTQMQSQEIKVTGTIKASGRDLVVVIENEQQRKNLTT